MATVRVGKLGVYFAPIEDTDRVECKICKKRLLSHRNFNLKSHLKNLHKIEVRLLGNVPVSKSQKLAKKKRKIQNLELEENLSYIGHSPTSPTAGGKAEIFNEYDEPQSSNGQNVFSVVDANFDDDGLEIKGMAMRTMLQNNYGSEDPLYTINETPVRSNRSDFGSVPKIQIRSNISEDMNRSLNEPRINTNQNHFQPRNITSNNVLNHTLNESRTISKDDNFDQWLKRRENLLNIEYLEMRNFEKKLQILEKEKHLQLPPSKFTKDIGGRLKK